MKIIDVHTTLLTGPCINDPFLSEVRKRRSAAFIEIITDGKEISIGETYAGYFCPEAVPAIVEFFKPILVGQPAEEMDTPELWRSSVTYPAGSCLAVGSGSACPCEEPRSGQQSNPSS